jgi:hypothetical protein
VDVMTAKTKRLLFICSPKSNPNQTQIESKRHPRDVFASTHGAGLPSAFTAKRKAVSAASVE